jgi:sporulation protein YlmC with PRC-barrel domain
MAAAHKTISAGRVEGTDVYNSRGEHLGAVEDIIIDKMSGNVTFALMSFGGFLGIGEKYHPIPWSMLKYDVKQGGYVVPLDRQALEQAPAYDVGELQFGDEAWNRRVYDYYKVPPFWI